MNKRDYADFICLYSYLFYNNRDMSEIMTFDNKSRIENGETVSLYEDMSIENIIARLFDNRSFKRADNKVKCEMIYNDYYPVEARISEDIYWDDRRNLCQELHNKVCRCLNIPECLVDICSFRQSGLDESCFYHYEPKNEKIYINKDIDFSNADCTLMSAAVIRGTYIHQIQTLINNPIKYFESITKEQQYLMISTLLKQFVVSFLKENGDEESVRESESITYNDGYSAPYIYAVASSYKVLDYYIDKLGLKNHKLLNDYNVNRDVFFASLAGDGEYISAVAEEEMDCTENYDDATEEDIEDDEYAGCEYDDENYDLEDEEPCESDEILYDTIQFDFDMLRYVEESELNKATENDLMKMFLSNFNRSSAEFYKLFNYRIVDSFENNYEVFKVLNDEIDDQENYEQ